MTQAAPGDLGLIPAHAGKTCFARLRTPGAGAHPRSRGENEAGDEKGSTFEGSSPLTRGKRSGVRRLLRRPGLIPAHAGKTRLSNSSSCQGRAHPRSRGENGPGEERRIHGEGSSPLTRGKLTSIMRLVPSDGLIPAHAGKTLDPLECR